MSWTNEQKSKMIQIIKKRFLQANAIDKGIDEEKLIAHLEEDFGVARKTAEQYIQTLIISGFIERDFGACKGLWMSKIYNPTEVNSELLDNDLKIVDDAQNFEGVL